MQKLNVDRDSGGAGSQSEKVSFFIAGVQKAGTSSLFAYCADHPEIVGSTVKETHFFDNENIQWSSLEYTKLDALYDGAGRGVRCDGTPIYIYWPPSIERIARYNDNARFVILFRDPIERAWSQWRMNYANGDETMPFTDAIRIGRHRLPSDDALAPSWRVFSYVERGLYMQQVRRLLSYVAADRVLYLRSEDLKRDPLAVLNRVADHLHVSRLAHVRRKTYNEAPSVSRHFRLTVDDIHYLQDLFRADLREFATLTNLDVSQWLTMSDDPRPPSDSVEHSVRKLARSLIPRRGHSR